MESTFAKYSDGKELYGDDFSQEQIEAWFRDEKEGYYNLAQERKPGAYGYFALNWHHGFKHLPPSHFDHVLGIGSAFGDELKPVLRRSARVTILEPSAGFLNPLFEYVKPRASGYMPFADNTFDLVTCFGVLHHIPNVSTVVNELARCMKPGGWCLIREPIISMGNWDQARSGLTRRERGIPYPVMMHIVSEARFEISYHRKCMFSLTAHLNSLIPHRRSPYNSRLITIVDDFICSFPFWSRQYHANNFAQKIRPCAVYLVLRKPIESGAYQTPGRLSTE